MKIVFGKKKICGEIRGMLHVFGASSLLRKELTRLFTFTNPAFVQASRYSPWGQPRYIPEHICLVEEEEKALLIPRGISPHLLSDDGEAEWNRIKWSDLTNNVPVDFPGLCLAPNREQRILIKSYEKAETLRPFRNFLIVSPTGTGKTISLAELARKTGQRTMILCLTEQIKISWMEDLQKAYKLKPNDLGLIQQKTWKIGEVFTLASVRTLARRKEKWSDLKNQIGTVIVDEVDTITAACIHDFVFNFPARFFLGGTATHLKETNNNYLNAAFGHPVQIIQASQKDTDTSMALQKVNVVNTLFTYEHQEGNLDWHDLTEHMMTDEERNQLIVNNVFKDWSNGLCPLVATRRIEHLNLLYDMLREKGVTELAIITGETNQDRLGTRNTLDKIFKRECRCVVASAQAVLRGANINPLDVLHLTMPLNKRDLEQAIGRVRRKWKKKNVCRLTYYLDKQVPYLRNFFFRKMVPVFQRLKVPEYENKYFA